MSNVEELVQAIVSARGHKDRRLQLMRLISKILSGEINSSEVRLDDLFKLYTSERDMYQMGGPRQMYVSPVDRSSYNYGYMQSGEMAAGTPAVWDP